MSSPNGAGPPGGWRVAWRWVFDHLVPEDRVLLAGDDTVDEHTGVKVFGKGCHRDPVRSTHSFTAFRWGHKWVVLTVLARIPGARRRGVAGAGRAVPQREGQPSRWTPPQDASTLAPTTLAACCCVGSDSAGSSCSGDGNAHAGAAPGMRASTVSTTHLCPQRNAVKECVERTGSRWQPLPKTFTAGVLIDRVVARQKDAVFRDEVIEDPSGQATRQPPEDQHRWEKTWW